MELWLGIWVPFFGTALGAAFVCFLHGRLHPAVQPALTGFAAGVMTAASVWSLLLPAIEQSEGLGAFAFLPAVLGFWAGVAFLLLDRLLVRRREEKRLGARTRLLVFAVVLHNIPEGMAVGVAFAGVIAGSPGVTLAGATALSVGIAIQNVPEGAIVSMPLHACGYGKGKALVCGVLSGAVEPVAAILTVLAAQLVTPALPYLLSFAAGAMVLVVVEELIPELTESSRAALGSLLFAAGFTVMMALDVALG